MTDQISTFIFTVTGAFAIWLTKGFKGPFDKEMVSINERNSVKGRARYFLGMAIWIGFIIILSVILTRPAKTKAYKGRLNEKGEIELEEVK